MQNPGFLYQDILDRNRCEDCRKSQVERVLYVVAILITVGFMSLFMANPYYWLGRAAGVDWDEVGRSVESQAIWAEQKERETKGELEEVQHFVDDYMRRGGN